MGMTVELPSYSWSGFIAQAGSGMTDTVAGYAYRFGEALAHYILNPALLSISLLLAAFCMLWLLAAISILSD